MKYRTPKQAEDTRIKSRERCLAALNSTAWRKQIESIEKICGEAIVTFKTGGVLIVYDATGIVEFKRT